MTLTFDSQIRMSTIEEMKYSKVWLDHNVQRQEILFLFFYDARIKALFYFSDDTYFTMCKNKRNYFESTFMFYQTSSLERENKVRENFK